MTDNHLISFPDNSLRTIYMGCQMSEADRLAAPRSPWQTQEGLWLEDDRRVEQGREQAVKADEDQTVCRL
jgi:hypothetical protein